MKRRSFIQGTAAMFAAMALPAKEIFQKIKPVTPTLVHLPSTELRTVDGRYVYNPGLDLEGVQDLTFHQHSVIRGGVITRIDSAMPWVPEHFVPENRIAASRIEKHEAFGFTLGRYAAARYSADEVLSGLMVSLSQNAAQMLIEIPEWRGLDSSPLDKINEAIYSETLEGREEAIRALPRRWSIRGDLQKLIPCFATYRDIATKQLKQRVLASQDPDQWQENLFTLLGHADELRAVRATDRLTGNAKELAAFRRRMAEKILGHEHDPFRALSTEDFRVRVRARMNVS